MFFSVLCLLCLCARLFICTLWSPAGKGLTTWLSFVVSNCEFVTFPLVSWVGCGTSIYRYLIVASSLLIVALAADGSKAVNMLLLIHCLSLPPLFMGFCVWSLFCHSVSYILLVMQ